MAMRTVALSLAFVLLAAFACTSPDAGRGNSTAVPTTAAPTPIKLVLDETGIGLTLPAPYVVDARGCSVSGSARVFHYTIVDPAHRLTRTGVGGEFILSMFDAGFPFQGLNIHDLQATLYARAAHATDTGYSIESAVLRDIDGFPGLMVVALGDQKAMTLEADVVLPSGEFIMLTGGFDLDSVSGQRQRTDFEAIVSSMNLSRARIRTGCS